MTVESVLWFLAAWVGTSIPVSLLIAAIMRFGSGAGVPEQVNVDTVEGLQKAA